MKTSLGSPMGLLTILSADTALPDDIQCRQGDSYKNRTTGRRLL